MDHDRHPGKKLWLAYLLAVPLGCFGAHRFYLGRNRAGAWMLCLWLSGFLIAWGVAIAMPIPARAAGWDTAAVLLMVTAWAWEVVDLFLLPGMVRQSNSREAAAPPLPEKSGEAGSMSESKYN